MEVLFVAALIIGMGAVTLAMMFIIIEMAFHLDLERPVFLSLAIGIGMVFLALVFGLIGLMLSGGTKYVEGACYRAVRHTSTVLMPVGKVLIPTTTSGISLEEIRCP